MKMLHHLILICAVCVLAGCSRPEPTLDEAIDALSHEGRKADMPGRSTISGHATPRPCAGTARPPPKVASSRTT